MMSQPLSAMELGFEDILKEWSKTGDQMYNLARETAQAMQQAFSDFFFDIMDGKLKSLADYVNAFLKSIARSIANIMAQEAAASIMSGGGNILSTIFGSAQGNIFDNGRLIPLAHGGIVIRPTFFPMANGMGLMGEAGPEAIMPLKRLANGNLGVQTDSAAQAVTNNLNVEIKLENKSSQQLSVSQGPTKFEFNKMIITAVIEDYQRNGMTRSILGKK
jgi:lambda family phage tail tape measure protein